MKPIVHNPPVRLRIVQAWLVRLGFCLLATIAASSASGADPKSPVVFRNPVGNPPLSLRDPCVLVEGKKFYLFGSSAGGEGVQCYESSDLVGWKLDGWAWHRSGIHVALGELRSPQVFAYQGMFCLVYSAWTAKGTTLGLAASTRPEGPYHDLHVPWLELGEACSSCNVFVDGARTPFLYFSQKATLPGGVSSAIYGVALAQDLSKITGQPVKLLEPSQRWELVRRNAFQGTDSPRVFRANGRYFMFYSANEPGSVERAVGYAVSEKPLGPWRKSLENPLLASQSDTTMTSPDDCSPFQTLDRSEWLVVYNTAAVAANPSAGRVVNFDRVHLLTNFRLALSATSSPNGRQMSGTGN